MAMTLPVVKDVKLFQNACRSARNASSVTGGVAGRWAMAFPCGEGLNRRTGYLEAAGGSGKGLSNAAPGGGETAVLSMRARSANG